MTELTLLRRASPLAQSAEQLRILSNSESQFGFGQMLARYELSSLSATATEVLQKISGDIGWLWNRP